MAKKATGSPHYWRCMLLAWFFGTLVTSTAYTQTPVSCSDVEQSHITSTAATCEGNGSITAPTFENAFYTLIGENVEYEVGPQNSGSFISLSPGTYTLKILCEGSTTPIEFTGIEVESNWQQLSLALVPGITCPGQGQITATASFGFNMGGDGAVYEFATWQGAVGAPDGDLTWITPADAPHNQHVFTGLVSGNHNVRVRDNCGNIWTQSVSIGSANTPTVNLSRSSEWVCKDGALVKRVTLNVGSLPAAPLRWSGYKYKVEYVAGTGNCGTQAAIGDPIVAETVIADDGWPKSFDLDNIPAGVGAYRITTISPCGDISYNCQSVTASLPTITLRRSYASCADPNSGSNTRLTYVITPNEFTSIQYPATITFTGQGGWTSGAIAIGDDGALSGIVNNIPNSAYPVTATFEDGCDIILTEATGNQLGIPGATTPSLAYNRTCVDFDHVNLDVSFNGSYVGVGDAGTTYELYNAADNNLVATGTLINAITNTVRFPNIPATGTYYVKIIPTAASGCSEQQTASFTLPGGNNYQGARIVANPAIQQNCTEETSIWNWNYGTNNFSTSGRTVRFRVWKVDDDPVAGPFVRNATNANNFVIEPGEYLWSVTNDYADDDCDRVLNAAVPVVVGTVQWNPVIEKSVASVCQDENGLVLTTGIAILQFAGNGPFRIEQRDAANPDVNSWATVPGGASVAGPTFEIAALTAGTTYIFRVVDQCGKSVTQQVTIRPLSPRIINRDAVQPCVGQPYVLEGVDYPGATYVWTRLSDNVEVSNTKNLTFATYTAADAGQYKLTLRLSTCLVRETTVTLGTEGCGQPFQLGSLGDYVWYDTNYDGLQDEDEAPAPGVSVTLQGYVGPNPSNPDPADLANNANWGDMETQLTGPDGKYKFEDLETGYYRVRFGNVPNYEYTGYQTGGADGDNRGNGNDSNAGAEGYSGPVYIDANGTGVARDNMTIDAGLVRYGSIGDYVWFDANLNGIQDGGDEEYPVEGVTVRLYQKVGETWDLVAPPTATDGDGKYLFDKLKSGTYQVEFVAPDGREFTQHYVNGASSTEASDSDADRGSGKSGEISIDVDLPEGNVGRNNMTIDAGLIPTGALPVRLSHFNAEKTTEGTALLTWSTTEEQNSSYFDVLQSADGSSWQVIGRVEAKGNSFTLAKYTFTDQTPGKGMNYYRLKIVDRDGSFEQSNIRSLSFEGTASEVTVYPNPVSDRFSIKTGAREKVSKVELFDANGRLAIVSDRYAEGESIVVKGLSGGTYILKITMANGASEIRKIVISNK